MGATNLAITIGGSNVRTATRENDLTIHDVLNDSPNSCTGTVDGTAPVVGQEIIAGLNTTASANRKFAGTIQTVDQVYEGKPANRAWRFAATDYTFLLNRRRPIASYTAVSASTVAAALVTNFATGFTSTNVAAALPDVTVNFDGSEGFSACLTQIAKLIGGYWYVDYDKDLHLFITEASAAPDDLDGTHSSLMLDPPVTYSTDLTQVRTRVYGRGHGEPILADLAISSAIVPINDATMFSASGGLATSALESGAAPTQLLAYTGTQLGGDISLIGPGVAPSVAPNIGTDGAGTGIEDGLHSWAYTYVTAAGQSLPSPLTAKTMETLPTAPAVTAINAVSTPGHGPTAAVTVTYAFAVIKDITALNTVGFTSGVTALGTTSNVVAPGNTSYDVQFTSTTVLIGRYIGLFRFDSLGSTWYLMDYILNGIANGLTATIGTDGNARNFNTAFSGTFQSSPWTAYATVNRATIAGVAIGPTGTTSRKIYRTAAAGSQLKLQQTIANNTATTGVMDSTADASLGANAPSSDTSGLTQPTGQVNAGSTSLLTAGLGTIPTAGFVTAGQQVIRYTGVTGNTLTGIPSSGNGSITGTLLYNTQVTSAPALTGVTGVAAAIDKGSSVYIWVQRDNTVAQTALAALEGGDGIHEGFVVDERRGESSLTALCDAQLELYADPIVTISYATRDIKTRAGKTIHVNLGAPTSLTGDFTIQDVTINEIDIASNTYPRHQVTASSVRFSLDDLLRRALVG